MREKPLNVLIVDDEELACSYLLSLLDQCDDVNVVGSFSVACAALVCVEEELIDLAFLDIEMPDMDGLTLANRIKDIDPCVEVVFTTGYEGYSLEAFKRYALGYLLKPCAMDDIRYYLDQAQLLRMRRKTQRLSLRAFGRFDAFVGGCPVMFSNAKAKELLALLVDADGGEVSMEQAIDRLWEDHVYDESVKALYRRALRDLKRTLRDQVDDEALMCSRGAVSLDMSAVNCDYHNYLQGASELFSGVYLEQYSWGEETLARLESQS